MNSPGFAALFVDIGGVLLSNGWDRRMREKAAEKFNLDLNELNGRHALTFDTYEIGKITLDCYLDRVVFYEARNFSKEEFKEFMFEQSVPNPQMIEMLRRIKKRFAVKIVAVSNEGRELMKNRIERFKMKEYIDFFICSAFVGLRKPDEEIYRIALDTAQVDPKEVIYVDDRLMLVEIARQMGMNAVHHTDYEKTDRILIDLLTGGNPDDR